MSANETVLPGERLRRAREEKGLSQEEACKHPVSYTHLTLPTICSV